MCEIHTAERMIGRVELRLGEVAMTVPFPLSRSLFFRVARAGRSRSRIRHRAFPSKQTEIAIRNGARQRKRNCSKKREKRKKITPNEEITPIRIREIETETTNSNSCQNLSPQPNSSKIVPGQKSFELAEGVTPRVRKYWFQRYNLFSMYDEGIKMDEEGWFSATPEEIAIRHAEKSGGGTVIDCFSGVGGNAIQFAKMGYHVVAIDIDPQKVRLAINNAKVYGVDDCIDFVIGDFFQLASSLKGDVVFLSPPWGGPSYLTTDCFTLDLLKPKDGYSIFQVAQKITPNIIMFLPRNVDLHQVEELSWLSSPPLPLEVEENYVQNRLKGITAYFGGTASQPTMLS